MITKLFFYLFGKLYIVYTTLLLCIRYRYYIIVVIAIIIFIFCACNSCDNNNFMIITIMGWQSYQESLDQLIQSHKMDSSRQIVTKSIKSSSAVENDHRCDVSLEAGIGKIVSSLRSLFVTILEPLRYPHYCMPLIVLVLAVSLRGGLGG